MNRLTDRSKEIPLPCADNASFWARAHEKLARYEDSGLEPEQCAKFAQTEKEGRYIVLKEPRSAGVHRLEEIARADIEGRLVVLPCKVGDTVYYHFQFK